MEINSRPAHPLPSFAVDRRPTADAAALAQDPRPEVPLPLPAGQALSGAAVSASLGPEAARRVSVVTPPERTLKPYGIAMLPEETARTTAADARARAADRPPEG
jgi:hypothetical protein